ncbi:MAG TPA: SRPBCC domain-containing protein [Polyangiaceae bacterium]
MMPAEERTTVRVSYRFSVPPRQVFEAWLNAERAKDWLPNRAAGEELAHVDLIPKVGRPFLFGLRSPAGAAHTVRGEFLEIIPPRRLVFTWVVPSVSKETTRVTVELHPSWNQTDLTLKHERVLPEEYARTIAQWNALLERMAASLGR